MEGDESKKRERSRHSVSEKLSKLRGKLKEDPERVKAIRERMKKEASDKVQKEMEKSKKKAEQTGETLGESIKKRNKK